MTFSMPDEKQRLADLRSNLHRYAAPAAGPLVESAPDNALRCLACAHRCLIKPGHDGVCRVRFNDNGKLMVPFGYVAGLACDPIEKKPFFHVLPASDALSFGMLGCDLHCAYCQNWVTSQMLRDPRSTGQIRLCQPAEIVNIALQHRAPVIASTYNEPLITTEWAVEVFKLAKPRGLRCVYISNGNATPEVLQYIRPYVDAYKVDLKTFNDRNYRQLGGVLENVVSTIRLLKQQQFWVEIVTLVVPGFSDNADDLKRMAGFIASVDPLIPWHLTAFHTQYKMTDAWRPTVPNDLLQAVDFARQAGLKYVYAGNLPGQLGQLENTRCHNCDATLIRRQGFLVQENRLPIDGHCPDCKTAIPGIWGQSAGYGDGRVRHIA